MVVKLVRTVILINLLAVVLGHLAGHELRRWSTKHHVTSRAVLRSYAVASVDQPVLFLPRRMRVSETSSRNYEYLKRNGASSQPENLSLHRVESVAEITEPSACAIMCDLRQRRYESSNKTSISKDDLPLSIIHNEAR